MCASCCCLTCLHSPKWSSGNMPFSGALAPGPAGLQNKTKHLLWLDQHKQYQLVSSCVSTPGLAQQQ
jgi:hypothetical protein